MGLYDLPACFDYITNITGVEKLNYIGHSMGTMQMFAALTLRPDYFESKLTSFVALAPVTELYNLKSLRLRYLLDRSVVGKVASYVHEAFTVPAITGNIITVLCKYLMPICSNLFRVFSDIDISDLSFEEKERFFDYISRLPSSTSSKSFQHFEMIYQSKSFIHYDYGVNNMKIYGQ